MLGLAFIKLLKTNQNFSVSLLISNLLPKLHSKIGRNEIEHLLELIDYCIVLFQHKQTPFVYT
jgi:hypothetical protein